MSEFGVFDGNELNYLAETYAMWFPIDYRMEVIKLLLITSTSIQIRRSAIAYQQTCDKQTPNLWRTRKNQKQKHT